MQDANKQQILTAKTTIIFDLDGTLVDSAPDLANSVNAMLTSLNRDSFDSDTIHGWVGNGAKILVERALSGQLEIDTNLDEEYCAYALAIFLDHYQQNVCVDTQLYDGVKLTLNTLKERGYNLHIVTNKPLMFVKPILDTLDIVDCFNMVLGADSLPKKKPDPMPLAHICNEHDVSIGNCVMVGDSQNDILAANAIEMESIAVTYGYNYGKDIREHKPTVVCDQFSDLLNYLPALN